MQENEFEEHYERLKERVNKAMDAGLQKEAKVYFIVGMVTIGNDNTYSASQLKRIFDLVYEIDSIEF